MPHVTIHHFDAILTENQKTDLSESIASAVVRAFGCSPHALSIALRPISEGQWSDAVVAPLIESRRHELIRFPNYEAI